MLFKIINFLKSHYKSILWLAGGLFILYWVIFILTPSIKMSETEKAKIDSINQKLELLHKDNLNLETEIDSYNQKIESIDNSINNYKGQKTIIKEFYHEKIISVDKLSIAELDSFFANRYK